jgi:hypothetical protein
MTNEEMLGTTVKSEIRDRMALTVQGEGGKLWREEIDGNQPFPQWLDPTGEKETLRKDTEAVPDTELSEWVQRMEEKYGWAALSRRLEQDWLIGPGDVARYIRSKKV